MERVWFKAIGLVQIVQTTIEHAGHFLPVPQRPLEIHLVDDKVRPLFVKIDDALLPVAIDGEHRRRLLIRREAEPCFYAIVEHGDRLAQGRAFVGIIIVGVRDFEILGVRIGGARLRQRDQVFHPLRRQETETGF